MTSLPDFAVVKPRVYSPETGDSIPLEDEILSFRRTMSEGLIEVLGGPGAGKTTALRYLAERLANQAEFCERGFLLRDDHTPAQQRCPGRLVVCTGRESRRADVSLVLTPWRDDEWIEYLLHAHPRHCRHVMGRIAEDKSGSTALRGVPELWRPVLDALAADDSIATVADALHGYLLSLIPPGLEDAVGDICLQAPATEPEAVSHLLQALALEQRLPSSMIRMLRHHYPQSLLGADRMVSLLHEERASDDWLGTLPLEVLIMAASQLSCDARALAYLDKLLGPKQAEFTPLAASLLVRCRPNWHPRFRRPPNLEGAYLQGVRWNSLRLRRASMTGVWLDDADLRSADMRQANARRAHMHRIRLEGANLSGIRLNGADLRGANLRQVDARRACLRDADLEDCDLEQANLHCADLRGAVLSRAVLREADLSFGILTDCTLDDADLADAMLDDADLTRVSLRNVQLDGASMFRTILRGCSMQAICWPNARLAGACLSQSYLTDSDLSGSNLAQADLSEAGLANIQWENTDLMGCNFDNASFHLGSTRSGLVNSPYPSHGTRTGFYTDDFDQQQFRDPEEIRVANLRGADLRGARVENVDFYLVDLRDARYDQRQAKHFRSCGAFL